MEYKHGTVEIRVCTAVAGKKNSGRCMAWQLGARADELTVIFFWKLRWLRLLLYLSMRSRRSSALYLTGAATLVICCSSDCHMDMGTGGGGTSRGEGQCGGSM